MKNISILATLLALTACAGANESESDDQDLRGVKVPFVTCTLYDNTADWEYRTFYFAKTTKKAAYKVETTIRSKPAEIQIEADKKGILHLGFTAIESSTLAEDAPSDGSWSYKDVEHNDVQKGNRDFALVCQEVTMRTMEGFRRIPELAKPIGE